MILLDHTVLPDLRNRPVLLDLAAYAPANDPYGRITVPALCLVAASTKGQHGLHDALARLDGTDMPELTAAEADGIDRLMARGLPWEYAHPVQILYGSGPLAHDHGAHVIVSLTPAVYDGFGVSVVHADTLEGY